MNHPWQQRFTDNDNEWYVNQTNDDDNEWPMTKILTNDDKDWRTTTTFSKFGIQNINAMQACLDIFVCEYWCWCGLCFLFYVGEVDMKCMLLWKMMFPNHHDIIERFCLFQILAHKDISRQPSRTLCMYFDLVSTPVRGVMLYSIVWVWVLWVDGGCQTQTAGLMMIVQRVQ